MDRSFKIWITMVGILLTSMWFFIGLWTADIGFSAMATGTNPTNGWVVFNPMQHYHAGLYMAIGSFVAIVVQLAFFASRVLGREK